MKRLTTSLMIAAAVTVAAGSAAAQTLKAEIPFTFRTQGAVMAPGAYQVTTSHAGRPVITLRNLDNGKSVMIANYTPADPSKALKAGGDPKLTFECGSRTCVLSEMWKGGDAVAYKFAAPKWPAGEDVRTAEIALTGVKAD